MRYNYIKIMICTGIIFSCQAATAQHFRKSHMEQALEYYFTTQQYHKALQVLDTIDQQYDLSTLNLNFSLKISIKENRKALSEKLLKESIRQFDFQQSQESTETDVKEWLNDSTFTFSRYFGQRWDSIMAFAETDKQFSNLIRSNTHQTLINFLSVDQFIRFNDVTKTTFIEVDSVNLDNFIQYLSSSDLQLFEHSRFNSQIINILLRHTGAKRFQQLDRAGTLKNLITRNIISNNDYALLRDYLHTDIMYFPDYDAFINEDWSKSKIPDQSTLITIDKRRADLGLLPLEYSAFCIKKNVLVPISLKYALPVETIISLR